MNKCRSFLPVIDKNSKILILGSMPGVKSLDEKQYYAHPNNRFWKLIGLILNCFEMEKLDYDKKLKILLENEFALWDVIKSCERKGSLDSNIQKETKNDIEKLLKTYNVKKIFLNGNKAYNAFKKYFPDILNEYKCYKLPSTSPANVKYKLDDLYKIWHAAFKE